MESHEGGIEYPSASSSRNHSILDMSKYKVVSLWELSKAREEPIAVISVKDMQVTAHVGADAWGTAGSYTVAGNKSLLQPVLVSVSLSLRQPFKTASDNDDLTEDTIHYGLIRKSIIDAMEDYKISRETGTETEHSLFAVMDKIHFHLHAVDKLAVGNLITWSSTKLMLPKSSLLGAGMSLTRECLYKKPSSKDEEAGPPLSIGRVVTTSTLRVHDLTVPTIIGMLAKERTRKQHVVANVEVDKWDFDGDCYYDMEQIISKTIEESSFQTLEALAEHIGKRVSRYILIPRVIMTFLAENPENTKKWKTFSEDYTKIPWKKTGIFDHCPTIKIKLEKPGIYLDTTPSVELTMDTRPMPNSPYFELWKGWQKSTWPARPLMGTLEDWVAEKDPEGPQEGNSGKVDIERQMADFQARLADVKKFTGEVISRPSSSESKDL